MGINPTKNIILLLLCTLCLIHLPVSDLVCSSQHPVEEAEGGIGEANQDRVDHVTHPHWSGSHTEVKEDTMTVNSKKGKSS